MIALISFIGLWLLNFSSFSGGDRSSQYAETVPTPATRSFHGPPARSAPAWSVQATALPDHGAAERQA
jgi:hypothetical protein